MNEKKLVQNFKSYINVSSSKEEKNGTIQEVKPKLLTGELVTGVAHNVVMLTPLSERDHGRLGSVFVTNYKLSFVPLERSQQDECSQRNHLLGPHDVPLLAVGAVWLTDGGPVRRRRLMPCGDMPGKVKGLQIICKNMKVITFSFTTAPMHSGRKIALSLMHHAFPKRHHLLFAFEYHEPYYPTLPSELNMFQRPGDWKRELERCECPHWRITCINGTSDAFMLTAGETLIVPNSVLDYNLVESARHFRSGRVPVWVWGRPEGAALLRSGELLPTEQAPTAESVLLEQIRRSHPKLTPPQVLYLCGNSFTTTGSNANILPPLSSLQASFKKLMDLCTPTKLSGFWVQDAQYHSVLESSKWLRHVATCLALADEAAHHLARNVTVVLQEGEGVDYSAVVSSLTQLLLEPHWRTLVGFQSLVQKEWLALGHPFCDRLPCRYGLPSPGNPKETREQSPGQVAPVFLLFLDCTWQLTRQFPASFQFTETYLTTLWDCTHNQIFDTFLFNCSRDRELAYTNKKNQQSFVPVWDWGEQFSEQDKALFYNPLYAMSAKPSNVTPNRSSIISSPNKQAVELPRLEPCTSVAGTELWSQCYERWLLPLDVPHAGDVQYHVFHYAVLKEIQQLNEKLNSLSIFSNRQSLGGSSASGAEGPGDRTAVSRFYPFSRSRGPAAPALDAMQLSAIDAASLLDSLSLLNAPD
ncbi:myotubularin-related protein 10-A isoform X3 [Bombyx mori]|uniref:myotubularin-related protein 10-A isoform X3 n=1 Tax=Bombyx mori TaxID=7091 RepID=UPI002ED0FCC9